MKKIFELTKFLFQKSWPIFLIVWLFVFLEDWNKKGLWLAVWWVIFMLLSALLLCGLIYLIGSTIERIKKRNRS